MRQLSEFERSELVHFGARDLKWLKRFQDTGFVVDTAQTIYRALQEENVTVRMKASWGLGNLSDALLVLERPRAEEISPMLLLKLLQVLHEKIRSFMRGIWYGYV